MVRRRRAALIVSIAGMVLSIAPAIAASQPGNQMLSEHLTVDGARRDYLLFVPASYTRNNAVHSLALVFHGLNNDDTTLTRFVVPAASERGLVVAFPQGIDDSWNAGQCCGAARALKVDDVAFASALIATLSSRYHPRSVVAAGYSNGAMLSWRLACERAGEVVGIVDASGTQALPESGCRPDRPLIVTSVHGRKDSSVPYNGGGNPAQLQTENAAPFRPINDVMSEWGHDHDGCGFQTVTTWSGGSTTRWVSCSPRVSATLYTIDGMGHDVPNYAAGEPVDFGILIADAAARSR